MALGHQSGNTKQHYGYQQQGGDGSVKFPADVSATNKVKTKNKLKSVTRKKSAFKP